MEDKKTLNFRDYLTIKDAAELLGLSPNTIRNWEKQKRIKTYKAPWNPRRLYKKSDLMDYLNSIKEI